MVYTFMSKCMLENNQWLYSREIYFSSCSTKQKDQGLNNALKARIRLDSRKNVLFFIPFLVQGSLLASKPSKQEVNKRGVTA